MKKTGITGTIGSGKTLVSEIFKCLGIPVFDADAAARSCYADPALKNALRKRFGKQVFNDSGNPDFGALASLVFSDKESLGWLNSKLHPMVIQKWDEWMMQLPPCPYSIIESAILFETGYHRLMDCVISVSAPYQLCIERVMKRNHSTAEQIRARMNNQWDDERKKNAADFVICNDDKTLVIPQVLETDRRIREMV